jgi:hypothetical protein
MNIQEAMNLVMRLPQEKQMEVFDFIAFLYGRTVPRPTGAPRPPLEQEPLCGLWKDREDMADGVSYIRNLRRREWP